MSFLHCFCCCFIRNRKAKIGKPLAIKYWDDPEEVLERPQTPDARIKRKKRVNLFEGITNLKHSTRKLRDDDDDDDEDDEDDDEVEVLLEEGVQKSSISYYFSCFKKNVNSIPLKGKNTKKKKKKKKKKKQLNAENEDDNENEENEVIPDVEENDKYKDIEENESGDETKTRNDDDGDGDDVDNGTSSKTKDPKVDEYKEKKRQRKLQKEQQKLQKKLEDEEAARLAGIKPVEEVEEEYSKYHSVQHFALGTSLLDIAAEQEKFKIETIKWRSYKRKKDKKTLKENGWEDRVILNSGCPKEFIPEGYVVEELAPPALELKYINHRKIMFHWYDDQLKPPVHGWFLGIVCSAKKHGFNFCIKYDDTKNKVTFHFTIITTVITFKTY